MSFIDSNGIGVLLGVAVSVRERGGRVTMHASPVAHRVIRLCGVDHYLGLVANDDRVSQQKPGQQPIVGGAGS